MLYTEHAYFSTETLSASFMMIKKALEIQIYIFVSLIIGDPLIPRNYDKNFVLMSNGFDQDIQSCFDASKIFWSFFKFNIAGYVIYSK